MGGMLTLFGALLALVGTAMQAVSSLRELAQSDPEIASALAIDALHREVPRWRVLSFRRHRRLVAELKKQSPREVAAYRRVWSAVYSWAFLCTASLLLVVGSIVSLMST